MSDSLINNDFILAQILYCHHPFGNQPFTEVLEGCGMQRTAAPNNVPAEIAEWYLRQQPHSFLLAFDHRA
jgi:hypothetical protein